MTPTAPATGPTPGPVTITGTVEGFDNRYVDDGQGNITHFTGAIVAFPIAGGGSIGVATSLQGKKIGDTVQLPGQILSTKDGIVAVSVQGLTAQTINVSPTSSALPTTTGGKT